MTFQTLSKLNICRSTGKNLKNKPLNCLTLNLKIMNFLKQILAVGLVMNVAILCAQQEAYVAAESGLTIRENPDVSAKKLGKLPYGEAIGILEETDIKLVVVDAGEKVSGEWVKVASRNHTGYVFNGYLSPTKIARTIRLNLDHLNMEIKNLATRDFKRSHNLKNSDSTTISVDVSDSPEGKNIVLVDNDYKNVSIFQRYENSISFMSADAHCNAKEWTHFDSEWKPIKQTKSNSFETLAYTDKNWDTFIKSAIEDLKTEVIEQCGADWLDYFKSIEKINDYPVGVSTNRIFLKIILTDFEDNSTEKIIEFEIPMGS
jgi:hypothetical protein